MTKSSVQSKTIIGHAMIINFLKKSIDRERLPNAYLFTGPVHVGKNTVAAWFIKTLLCLDERQPNCRCASCQALESGTPQLDLIKVYQDNPTSGIGIDQVRAFQSDLRRPPSVGRRVVGVIESASELSEPAMNALLKILEEPPVHTVIILISHQADRLLPTVVSRCQPIVFNRVPLTELAAGLKSMGLTKTEALTYARLSNGLPGLAINWQTDPETKADYLEVSKNLLNLEHYRLADRLEALQSCLKQSLSYCQTLEQFLSQWHFIMRDVLLAKVGCQELVTFRPLRAPINALAETSQPRQLTKFTRRLWQASELARRNVNQTLINNNLAFNYDF